MLDCRNDERGANVRAAGLHREPGGTGRLVCSKDRRGLEASGSVEHERPWSFDGGGAWRLACCPLRRAGGTGVPPGLRSRAPWCSGWPELVRLARERVTATGQLLWVMARVA